MEDDAATEPPAPVGLRSRLALLEQSVATLSDTVTGELRKVLTGLEYLVDDDPRGRRRLAELRASSSYEDAFMTPAPLVSVLIPTYDRTESLTSRAIPSVLGQSYRNVEVVVVGDCSPSGLVEAVTAIDDPRVRFHNLTINGPYEDDAHARWCASGTPPLNAALAQARGQWIAVLGDDDQLPETHIEVLLGFARRQRREFVYGRLRITDAHGAKHVTGAFPPTLGQINLQTSLWHAGLRFLEFELGQAALGVPNDWALIRRMMRVGVTMAQTETTTVDWVPSIRARAQEHVGELDPRQLRRRLAALEDRVAELEGEKDALSRRLIERTRAARVAEEGLQRRISEIQASRTWRMTAPLRVGANLTRRHNDREP